MALFESYERRIDKINGVLAQYGIGSVEECRELCKAKGFDPYEIVKGIQPICFENACWAYTVGAAIALKSGVTTAAEAAKKIGEGLQSFCIDGSVAEDRKVGLGHGNLGAMLLSEESKCFAFLAGHESFAAAEGAIGIVRNANKARKTPLRVILNGLGKDAAQIISRINGFTYVQTKFDYYTGELKIVNEIRYSEGERADVRCYGADDVREGVAIMHHEGVDVSITGNSTNPTRFQHPVAGTYKKECIEQGKKYFSVASGGGTGRTLHPDNMAAGHYILKTCGAGIEGNQDHVSVHTIGDTCCLHGIHRTKCLVIVLAYHYIELSLVALDVRLHNLLSASLCEITGLGIQNVPAVCICDLLEAVRTSDLCGSTGCSLDNEHVHVADALCIRVSL